MTGIVRPVGGGAELTALDGVTVKLALDQESRMLQYLDGHTVTVDGQRSGRRLRVGSFSVVEGLHGMQVWVGRLEASGGGMGLLDRNSGMFYVVDEEAEEIFRGQAGVPVLVEGFVNGPNQIKVMFYRALSEGGLGGP